MHSSAVRSGAATTPAAAAAAAPGGAGPEASASACAADAARAPCCASACACGCCGCGAEWLCSMYTRVSRRSTKRPSRPKRFRDSRGTCRERLGRVNRAWVWASTVCQLSVEENCGDLGLSAFAPAQIMPRDIIRVKSNAPGTSDSSSPHDVPAVRSAAAQGGLQRVQSSSRAA